MPPVYSDFNSDGIIDRKIMIRVTHPVFGIPTLEEKIQYGMYLDRQFFFYSKEDYDLLKELKNPTAAPSEQHK